MLCAGFQFRSVSPGFRNFKIQRGQVKFLLRAKTSRWHGLLGRRSYRAPASAETLRKTTACYFENFLHEFRRRSQRDELFREPLWSICVDRVRDFVFWHPFRPLAYYSATIVAAAACVAVIFITVHQQPDTTEVAVEESPVPSTPSNIERELDFAPSVFTPRLDIQPTLLPGPRNVRVLPANLPDSFRSDEFVPSILNGNRCKISRR